jgi:CBS domain-containing protein
MSAYTLARILEGRRQLICARTGDTVGDALRVMLASRVAQLPVVAADGTLRGMISQQGILSIYFYAGGQIDLLQMPLDHCLDPAVVFQVDDDLLAALDQLRVRGVYAIVVEDGGRPAGILTGRDMTYFFRSIFEGLLLVEQIEVTLRQCIGLAFAEEESWRQALQYAGIGGRNATRQDPGDLSFTSMLKLIVAPENWPALEPLLGPKSLFEPIMERVRQVRNEIAHFEERPDALELDTLRRSALWFANRRAATLPVNGGAALLIPDVRLHPLSEILPASKPPRSIEMQATIGDALRLMVENRYTQLPVVDPAGRLIGLITQPAILSLYFFTNGAAPLLTLPLHHALSPCAALTEEATFFQAVDLLTSPGTAAVVVTREQQPIGVLTGKDMTHAFRALCEGIILVERIERTLRDHVERAYPNEDALNAAAIAAFGQDPENPHYARRNPHKLTFGARLTLITDPENWPRFAAVLGPQTVFVPLMERVHQVRNKLLHFSGRLDPLERDALAGADGWLQQRPAWPA